MATKTSKDRPGAGAEHASRQARAFRVRKRMGLTQEKFARVVGAKVRTLSKLEKGQTPSDRVRRSITEAQRLVRALEQIVGNSAIADWMDRPNEAFDGLKPIEVIERGQIDRLWGMIYDLRAGSVA
jgi:transcriptional regulator with XRE-family HTH domain